ncbi:MAG TPA: four helix bundle protein [Balneola sp.]|nr:four helix bundle protein [Bacteroidota bacterium]MAC05295.1 four helix bundle protein [Balneola sp.]MAO78869.1 four helix bundle protein [Balneola sp.]MBF63528.1 four helix bundle protein [Balneola sp.]HAH49778.1 four helix bundle protein [Balneola sp.]
MKTFRDLKIWQQSMELVTEIYRATSSFPEEEKYGLTSQLRRSSVSIPSNISEGFGRNSQGDFKRFVNISMGSLFELQTQIEVARNLEFISKEIFENLYDHSREIERMMSSFIRTLK